MRPYIWSALVLLLLAGCDPVKRSIKRQERIDRLVADYLARNPVRADTVYIAGETVYRSDTIVNENIYVDTTRILDTVYVHQVKYRDLLKTFLRTDTVIYTINQSTGVAVSQYMLATENEKKAKKRANRYLSVLVILCSLIIIYISYRLFR